MFKSITQKLTLVIVFLVSSLLLLSMLFMSFYFEDYYESVKKSALSENLSEFSQLSNLSPEDLIAEITDYEAENSAKLFIYSVSGELRYMSSRGTTVDDNSIYILRSFFNDLQFNESVRSQLFDQPEGISMEYIEELRGVKYFLTALPLSLGVPDDSIAISISSLVPIAESAETIKRFFFYVFLGGLVIVILISLIVSRMVTKPLRKLSHDAKELSDLNFSDRSPTFRKDEIGDLENSLSKLSQNLRSALEELNTKNALLEKDIDRKERLEEERRNFIRDISHELKTPLALIQGYTEGLVDGVGADKKEEYLSVILEESRNMENLIRDMLELSYTESEQFKPNLTEFSISRLLQENLQSFRAFRENVLIEADVEDDLKIRGDREKMNLALRNILKNAFTYTEGAGTVTVRLKNEGKLHGRDRILLEVTNSPASIDAEDLDKIWVQFYKRDPSRHRVPNSTGLGLSIVKNILDRHGFPYSLQNVTLPAGVKGVTFRVELTEMTQDRQPGLEDCV